jgi:vitamin B12/bleomycin/antimicrobial peptide transport system ATP-binding/permease protein
MAAPQFLLLDEATSALDEALEQRLYSMLKKELPKTTLVSIGHRGTLKAMHDRAVVMVPHQNAFSPEPVAA